MTNPVTKTSKPQVNAYIQAQAGGVINSSDANMPVIGGALGGSVKYNGFHAEASAALGTAFQGKAKAGYEFDLGKNMGLDLSAKAQYTKNLNKSYLSHTENFNNKVDITITNNETGEKTYIPLESQEQQTFETKYNTTESRVGGAVELNYKPKWGKIGVGLEAGHRELGPDISNTFEHKQKYNIYTEAGDMPINMNQTTIYSKKYNNGLYITPTVAAEAKVSKHLSFTANADFYQANAGIKYTF